MTCDVGFAEAIERAYPDRFEARPHLFDLDGRDVLVVGYVETAATPARLTLSPFGLPAAIAEGLEPLRDVLAFERALRELGPWYRTVTAYLPVDCAVERGSPRYDVARTSTHLLRLDATYDALFSGRFDKKTRTAIRRADKDGVRVALGSTRADAARYYAVHRSLAEEKGGYGELHPESLFVALLESPRVELALAYVGDELAGGGVFLHDGGTTSYWHGATDRRFRLQQPVYAILSTMIRRAIARGDRALNFGGSMGMRSLESFKEAWGAVPVPVSVASARHPLARLLRGGRGSPSPG